MKTLQLSTASWFACAAATLFWLIPLRPSQAQTAIQMEFADDDSGSNVSARLVFTKSPKKLPKPKKMLFVGDQWLCEEMLPLTPPVGEYEFSVHRGPEFKEIRGGFIIEPKAKDVVTVEIPRAANMHAEHWYSGDHLSSLPFDQLARWQVADAVDLAVTIDTTTMEATATNRNPDPGRSGKADSSSKASKKSKTPPAPDPEELKEQNDTLGLRLTTISTWLDWKQGTVIVHGKVPEQANPVSEQKDAPEIAGPTSKTTDTKQALAILEKTRGQAGFVAELVRPWARDVPILLGNEWTRSVQVLSSYNRPTSDDRLVITKSKGDKKLQGHVLLTRGKEKTSSELFAPMDPDDELKFNHARGVGRLSETIYWKMLEAGLRIAPTAGSDFGSNDSHVGYNRVYVHSEMAPTDTLWWELIGAGRTMVTNGPLLRVSINGMFPGSVQGSYRGQSIPLDIAASLSVREAVDYLDVVFNGETIYSAKLEDHYKRGEFPPLEISESGWVVVRVITAYDKGYRLATTAPFYFEFDGKPRVSRDAVMFFQRWLQEATQDIEASPEKEAYGDAIERAKSFWQMRLEQSK